MRTIVQRAVAQSPLCQNLWNERFLAAGEATPRTLEMDDFAPVLTDDLYAGADYYFDGV